MDFGLTNRVALVAAASRGIGFACALQLANEGARVFLCSRDEARASEAARKTHEQTVSTELAAENVTVNNVAPGYTLTERQHELAEARGRALGTTKEDMIAMWASETPLRCRYLFLFWLLRVRISL